MLKRWIIKATNSLHEIALIYAGLLGVSSVIFMLAEGKSFWDSLWWSVVTSTSTGYGDISPTTLVGRLDGAALMILSIFFIVPMLIVHMVNQVVENKNEFSHVEQEEMKEQIREIRATVRHAYVQSELTKDDLK